MTLNFVNILKRMDFLKYKKIYFIVFAAVFIGFIATTIFIISNFMDNFNGNIQNKTTIEIPFSEDIDEEELKEIKEISNEFLNVNCEVQKPETMEGAYIGQKSNLIISFFNDALKEDPSLKEKIKNMANHLKEQFKEKVKMKNIEEIITTNYEKSDIENLGTINNLAAFAIVFLIILTYFAISFRKLNSLFIVLSFLAALIFNLTVAFGLFTILIGVLNFTINNLIFIFSMLMVVAIVLNTMINANFIFNKLKKAMILKNEYKKDQILNFVLFSKVDFVFNNLLIFTVIPSLAFLFLGIINSIINSNFQYTIDILPFLIIYFVEGIVCFCVSIFMIIPIWSVLKKNKI